MKCRYVNDWGDECGNDALDYGWCPFHLKQMYGPDFVDQDGQQARSAENNGGDSSYYDLPRDPLTGAFPKTLQQVIKWWDNGKGMSWNQANIFKATYRWDKKPDIEYNCNKIKWFNDDMLEDIYRADPDNPRGVNYERDGPEGD